MRQMEKDRMDKEPRALLLPGSERPEGMNEPFPSHVQTEALVALFFSVLFYILLFIFSEDTSKSYCLFLAQPSCVFSPAGTDAVTVLEALYHCGIPTM